MENRIMQEIFHLLNFEFEKEISYSDYNGVKVIYDGKTVEIGFNSKSQLARGYFLLAKELSTKNAPFHIEQTPHFENLGAMLDVSRGAVMTVDSIKKYILNMAAIGFNTFLLYMEDMFEMEEYPRFGYMRGRYTQEELKEVDDFANLFGIEVIPCIQALSHHEQYLQWSEAASIKDTAKTLLVDEPKTYKFIETMIKTMRKAFRSNRINLNIDETHDLGLGMFLKKNGYQNKMDILLRHIKKVDEICKSYNYKPMMSADMFFRFSSKTNEYFDLDVKFSEDIIKMIPENIDLINWAYEFKDKNIYKKWLEKHRELKRNIVFMGCIWTWEGFFEDTIFTLDTSIPAMQSCVDNNVKDVFISMWGDNGGETNLLKQTVSSLAIFSEYCFRGNNCTMVDITEAATYLTKFPLENKIKLMEKLHSDFHDYDKLNKSLIYSDIFYNLVDLNYDYSKVSSDYKEGIALCEKFMREDSNNNDYYKFCYLSFKIGYLKLELFENLKKKYLEKDSNYLKLAVEEYIPNIISSTKEFYNVLEENWEETNKPFGLENMQIRIGGIILRAEYIMKKINRYLLQEITKIEELEHNHMLSNKKIWLHNFRDNVTANVR